MNIIFYRYKSICEPDFIDAFLSLGLNVIEDNDGSDNTLSLDQRINHLGNFVIENPPLFIFSINYIPFIALLCERLHVYYVAVSVDCPVFEIYNTSIKSPFNRIFLFDKEQYNSVRSENPAGIFHLPLGAACERLTSDTDGYEYDISFVGSLYKEKDPFLKVSGLSGSLRNLVDSMIENQIHSTSYGNEILKSSLNAELLDLLKEDENFYPSDMSVHDISEYVAVNDYLCPHATYLERVEILNLIADSVPEGSLSVFTGSDTSNLSNRISRMGTIESLIGMPKVFRQSKINLNITTRSITSGLSQRVWDILACKGFLITNYQPEIDMYFKDGYHLVTYKNQKELIDKTKYYLTHDKEREQIAQAGFEEVCKNGSVTSRVISILRSITS